MVSECDTEEDAEELIHYLVSSPEEIEDEQRTEIATDLDRAFPGAIMRG